MNPNENCSEAAINAYLRAKARLASTQAGTPDFEIEQTALEVIWESLNVEEKAKALEENPS